MTLHLNTREVDGAPDVPGEGRPRVNAFVKRERPVESPKSVKTLHENFLEGVLVDAGARPFLGVRPVTNGVAGPFIWQTYKEVFGRVQHLSAGFVAKGMQKDDNVGIFSINRPEWVIAEHACFMNSLVTVPLYDTLGREAIEHIVTETDLRLIVATKDKAKLLLDMKASLPQLKIIVIMDTADDAIISLGKQHSVEVINIVKLEREGAQRPLESNTLPTPESIATICYTSGTTGLPKGVVLTHKNMLAFLASYECLSDAGRICTINRYDSYLSYLPLAHVFERVVQIILTNVGARMGFYQGDTLKLLDDVGELKPTVFASVPRLYNRIYDKVLAGVKAKGGIGEMLFNKAYAAKKEHLVNGQYTHWLWDRLVFSKIRARLGGNVKMMLSGAAPISADVIDFLRVCFSCEVYEGYGQTETCAGLSVTDKADYTIGHVGVPIPSCEVKLADVLAMNYRSTDKPNPRGEILVRGSNVFSGYYKSPEKTAEAFTKDGWLRTGDIGIWDDKGNLKIVDRVKNIFKLAQGEYIAPEKIEIALAKHEIVAQVFVYGDSLQSTLVGVIVPDEDMFKKWAAENNFGEKAVKDLCKDEAVKKAVLKLMDGHGKKEGLKGFEIIKAVHLDDEPFSSDNGLLTPTFKLKRFEAKQKYFAQINAMYGAMAPAPA